MSIFLTKRGSPLERYSIINNLIGLDTNNLTTEIFKGKNYQATLSFQDRYTVILSIQVLMDGNDITSEVYSEMIINIPEVTGNIEINAIAVQGVYINITGSGYYTTLSPFCRVTINGSNYTSATNGILAYLGDTITCDIYTYSAQYTGYVKVNGVIVAEQTARGSQSYDWVIPSDIKSITINLSYNSSGSQRYGRVEITTS